LDPCVSLMNDDVARVAQELRNLASCVLARDVVVGCVVIMYPLPIFLSPLLFIHVNSTYHFINLYYIRKS
jgi:hypothetical protein